MNIRVFYHKLLGKQFDPISLIAVYSEILNKLYFLGFAYTLAYAHSVYLEWGKVDLTNCYLSFSQLIISLSLVGISLFYRTVNANITKLVRILFFSLVLIEIETGFHDPSIPYFDPRNWLTIIALIGTNSFFYPGLVWQFIFEWTLVFFIYLLRVFIQNDSLIPEETWREMSTTVPLFLVSFFLNHWWFQTRYIAAYRGMLLEEKRRTFFQDIHDSLGSKLTDLVLLCQTLESHSVETTTVLIHKIKELSSDALESLRNQVKEEDQREILQESLIDGLQLLVKKRYKMLGREILIQSETLMDRLVSIKEPETAHHILQIFKEISTNDLRHGSGKTICCLEETENSISIEFATENKKTQAESPNLNIGNPESFWNLGIGEKGIEQRIQFLNGQLEIHPSPYSIKMEIPKTLFLL
ncbi:histidine kinase [Leptospira levettii]|uniref:Histidine kinase n=1 Tax=Leptospira levettii TaxID=2023178 RepID=A0ABY2MSV9_9LEPT|nr:histidine kinase [Leptospira levettii]MCG6149596.1 histidine kinase [Leptospira levettii]MCW7498113.1 histidine kinase [Leptospira levettii]MCW7509545.1 histidine kinase [Leptospira levettii]MCW7520632.1 histidine kinase [Leptospira levettii]PJZ90011.1 histidine kinase [Leptospira levettii]